MKNPPEASRGKLSCEAVRPGAAPGPGRAGAVGLPRARPEVPEVDALVGGAAVKAQVQVLVVLLLHRVHHLLRHPHGEGQVAAHLADHDGRPDVPGLDLHVLGAASVGLASVPGAVGERGGQLVRLGVVRLLLHALLEAPEDDGELQEERGTRQPAAPPSERR
uniref:Uncharacterized protein n=1 Tax=Kryptolebias marmoratus TaxID=37003 RepID=A0A3Q3GBI0_KRYMA